MSKTRASRKDLLRHQSLWSTWRRRGATPICFRCHRGILVGDTYRLEVVYDQRLLPDPPPLGERMEWGAVEVTSHKNCDQYKTRPRLALPEPRYVEYLSGEKTFRRLIMDTNENHEDETTTPRRSKKAKRSKAAAAETNGNGASKAEGRTRNKKAKGKKAKGNVANLRKRTPEEQEDTRRSAAASLASALSPLLKGSKGAKSILATLASGEHPSNSDMVKLKELVKAEAAKAREAEDQDRATALSAANRLVRRIERATRD